MDFYLRGSGRICRRDFWLRFVLVFVGLNVATELIDRLVLRSQRETGPAALVLGVALLWPQIAITTKRLHDRGMSGWWQIAFNVGLVVPILAGQSIISDNGGFEAINLSLR